MAPSGPQRPTGPCPLQLGYMLSYDDRPACFTQPYFRVSPPVPVTHPARLYNCVPVMLPCRGMSQAKDMASSAAAATTQPRRTWQWLLFVYIRSALLLLPWLARLFIADIALSGLLPVSVFLPGLCHVLASRIAGSIWTGIQHIFTHSNHARITVSGAEQLRTGESAIVISNHVEWTDFYMLQELAIRAGMLGQCRWFAKQQLRWVPYLGWGLWAMGMPLVSRQWAEDKREMERVFRGPLKRRQPIWLIAYSEATRYTPIKRLEAEAWCRAHGRRLGRHLLYPRSKGFVACVQTLRKTKHVTAVYDVTIAYAKDGKLFQLPPSFAETVMLPDLDKRWRFFVHVDRHAINELPQTAAGLAQWLEDRWVEKGERLEKLRQVLADGDDWTADTFDVASVQKS